MPDAKCFMDELFRTLPKLLKEFEDNEKLRESVTFAAWRKVAGKSLGEHTAPFRLFKKHLVVAVRDKMWKRHLEQLSGQMIFKLNSILGQAVVTFIEFRIDEETVRKESRSAKQNIISDDEFREIALEKVSPKLRYSADAIKDDNLRYQFLLAAGGCLARKEKLKKDKN